MTTKTSSLEALMQLLSDRARKPVSGPPYAVPTRWLTGGRRHSRSVLEVNPFEFYRDALSAMAVEPKKRLAGGKAGTWTAHAAVYNMFVRATSAFDHDQNGSLGVPVNAGGWRETGTFLKSMALLPLVRSMGVNTIHLLPVTAVGADGNKGTLGSPYAMKNPFLLDPNLSEPALGAGAEEEFKAFVECAHHLGMRVVVEFVFRTSARDSDWVKEHPEWFYWIRESVPDRRPGSCDEASYGSPLFSPDELRAIREAAEQGRLDDLVPPHAAYREMFTPPPPRASVAVVNGRYVGTLPGGTKVRIPGAFADWPPDDSQPPWGDVTYLKMYTHPEFNYIAYNTIRMYDRRLAQPFNANTELWKTVGEIIPHYQKEFGIDGVMIDMGHALPMDLKREMVRRARDVDPDFAFWDETFSVSSASVEEGYNAVAGYQWCDQHHPKKFRAMLQRCATEGFPIPYFATPESHNTPRAAARKGGILYSQYAWAVGSFLPAVPFIHSGFELGETVPVNTGLDFTAAEIKAYPSDRLPLFSEHAYGWTRDTHIIEWIGAVGRVRAKYEALVVDRSPHSFRLLECENENVFAFVREKKGYEPRIVVLANSHMESEEHFTIKLDTERHVLSDLLMKRHIPVHRGTAKGALHAGEVVVAEF